MSDTAVIICLCAAIAIHAAPAQSVKPETYYLDGLRNYLKEKNQSAAEGLAAEFFKVHPKSTHVPDARLMLADLETTPSEALLKYKTLVEKFKFFGKNDYAQYRICEIHYLSSNWRQLKVESQYAIANYPASKYRNNFMTLLIVSELELGEYESAEQKCRRLIESDHNYNGLAASLLLLAGIHKKSSGLSKQYITTIREIASGFENSDAMPATLFLMGEFYESKKMHDEAYSAFLDCASRFPGSPEAVEAGKRIKHLMQYNPRKVAYQPGKKIIDSTEGLDISPEIDLPDESASSFFYSLAVGPFGSLKSAAGIKKLLNEYDFIKTVRLKNGYTIYVSRCPDEETVLKVKIRLAEEYGINGRIVRISSDGKNSYIYGD